jgi:AraC-like DNA-binding protein
MRESCAVVRATSVPQRDPAVRLAAFNRVSTARVDDAADEIGRIFCPHDLAPARGTASDFFALHNCAVFDGFSVNYVAYGGSVSIDPGCLERFFLLQIPVHGSARIQTAARTVATAPGGNASLLSPTVPTRMNWENDCAQIILLVDRRLMEHRAAALSGRPVATVEFEPEVDLGSGSSLAIRSQIFELVDLAERLGPQRQLSLLVAANLRETLLGSLLHGLRHSASDDIDIFGGKADALPRSLRRAREFLHAHAEEPLDLAQLSVVAGTGIRALQLGFRRHFGVSISQMLLDIRLAHLNGKLAGAAPDQRITDIAFELGFTHLSRMASAYRAKFGEPPSATMRRHS